MYDIQDDVQDTGYGEYSTYGEYGKAEEASASDGGQDEAGDMTYEECIEAVCALDQSQLHYWRMARRLLEEALDRHQEAGGRDGAQALSQTIHDYDLVTQREREVLCRICPPDPEELRRAEEKAEMDAAMNGG